MADNPSATPDPFALWRQWLTDSERQWNAFLNEAMATDQYSQAMARSMDMFLKFQKSMNDSIARYFSALNIPTRTDVLGLADRLSAIEDRLVSIESTLKKTANSAAPGQASANAVPAPRPARTKKPEKA